MQVTQWLARDGERWVHHHIEVGHAAGDAPEAKYPAQRGWKNQEWQKRLGRVVDGTFVRDSLNDCAGCGRQINPPAERCGDCGGEA